MSVRNLRLILENTLGIDKQVNYICKFCYYQIRKIELIRKYINGETCKTSIQAPIISRLNNNNALLYNMPLSLTNRQQRVQNCVVHLVTSTRKGQHIKPVLFQLYWLTVRFRLLFKILFHTFNVLTGTGPVYLNDLIEKYLPMRMLRSEAYSLLRIPKNHTAMYGEISFRASAPRLRNKHK